MFSNEAKSYGIFKSMFVIEYRENTTMLNSQIKFNLLFDLNLRCSKNEHE
jgi:hypothetical protein